MYWGIPPEINAFRLTMMGAGPATHVPQIAAYTTAAVTHAEQGLQQAMTAAATSAGFQGFGGVSMLATATPMAAWLQTAGAHAEAAAATIQTGVSAYAAAVSATIPHATVVANRVREAVLESTNFMGINSAAIAETNAEYGEYWAQNAATMMGYLAAMGPVVSALSTPLPPQPGLSNPAGAAAGLAGLATEGIAAGVQMLGAGASTGGEVVSAGSSIGAGIAEGVSSGVFGGAGSGVQAVGSGTSSGGQAAAPGMGTSSSVATGFSSATAGSPQGATNTAPPAKVSPVQAGQGVEPVEQSGQSLLSQGAQAPMQMMSALESPLESLAQLPSSAAGQLSGLMGPLSALTGGMAGAGPGGGGLGAPALSAASAPWSGLSGANGGFVGGGSAVSAALTKPSAGGLGGGPVGLPGGWWANAPGNAESAEQPLAGLRSATASTGAMAPGMYGPMAAGGHSRRGGSEHVAVGEPDKTITLASAHAAPVLTSEGVVHVGQGG
ncbi:PPE domain-containing protein [Mycobacterium kansasii]|uniref:PPE domain-containing protein n=1 Tax=Mycobacterium kansasii TaxID=1768 RepID=UPI0004D6369F|nr:PPE domain-containing protein [Mycobacterium kansasii]KEP38786.1 hypothetical protein MKSMC1_60760 [Mycobacterium kansasii]